MKSLTSVDQPIQFKNAVISTRHMILYLVVQSMVKDQMVSKTKYGNINIHDVGNIFNEISTNKHKVIIHKAIDILVAKHKHIIKDLRNTNGYLLKHDNLDSEYIDTLHRVRGSTLNELQTIKLKKKSVLLIKLLISSLQKQGMKLAYSELSKDEIYELENKLLYLDNIGVLPADISLEADNGIRREVPVNVVDHIEKTPIIIDDIKYTSVSSYVKDKLNGFSNYVSRLVCESLIETLPSRIQTPGFIDAVINTQGETVDESDMINYANSLFINKLKLYVNNRVQYEKISSNDNIVKSLNTLLTPAVNHISKKNTSIKRDDITHMLVYHIFNQISNSIYVHSKSEDPIDIISIKMNIVKYLYAPNYNSDLIQNKNNCDPSCIKTVIIGLGNMLRKISNTGSPVNTISELSKDEVLCIVSMMTTHTSEDIQRNTSPKELLAYIQNNTDPSRLHLLRSVETNN